MINQRLLHNIKTLSHNVLDRVLEGNGDRSRIVSVLDDFYQHLYVNGYINRPCRVSITSGRKEYATANSAMQFRSGIEIKITNLDYITQEEIMELIHIVLIGFPQLVRILISMGFDTLRGKLEDNPITLDIRLADFVHYRPPMGITHYEEKPKYEKPKAIASPIRSTPTIKPIATPPIQRKNKEFNGDLYGNKKI